MAEVINAEFDSPYKRAAERLIPRDMAVLELAAILRSFDKTLGVLSDELGNVLDGQELELARARVAGFREGLLEDSHGENV